jgi:capsular polysaccharide biosynthesis protein
LVGYPEQDAVLADLNSRITVLERDYATLTSRKIDAMVSKESSPEWEVVLLSPPSQPVALRTKDYVRLSLGPLLGLLVGIGLAFFFDSLDHSVKTKSEAERILGIPVVASIVDLKDWDRKLTEPESKK